MRDFWGKYRSPVIITAVFVFLLHGAKLHSEIIGIDSEDLLHIQNDFYGGWRHTGRQGLIALKWLTDSLAFRPYFAGLLTLILFGLAASAFFLLWDKVSGKTEENGCAKRERMLLWVMGGLLLIAHPVITEQFYFTLQSPEICIGMLLTAGALFLTARFQEKKGIVSLIFAAAALLLSFSTYQSFVVLFIFGTVSALLLLGIKKLTCGETVRAGELLKGMLPYLFVFLAAFGINTVVTRLFFGSSDYLSGQILWGKADPADNLRAIAGHVFKTLSGYGSIYYHISFGILCMAALCLMLLFCRRFAKGNGSAACVLLFYLAALFTAPFLMTLVCGGAPAVRSQLVLPFASGFLAYLDIFLLQVLRKSAGNDRAEGQKAAGCREREETKAAGKRILRGYGAAAVGIFLVCVCGIWNETQTTMSLYYTDRMRYEQDAFLGRELIEQIRSQTVCLAGGEELPLAVIGRKPFKGNHACVEGEIIGKSFFDHDTEVEPEYFWSTRRVIGFLHTLGADYEQVPRERFEEAVRESKSMTVWPAEGSVQVRNGMIIVKLSEA